MRVRARLGSRRLAVDVTGADQLTVADVIRCASDAFNLENDVIGVSLNGEVFLGAADGDLSASAWGLVPGDLIHVRSENEASEQPTGPAAEPRAAAEPEPASQPSSASEYYSISGSSRTRSVELTESIPSNLRGLVHTFGPHTPCHYLALVCHALFNEAGFLTPPDEVFNPRWSDDTAVVRLSYHYKGPQVPAPDKAPVVVTLMDCDHFVTASAQVAMAGGRGSYFSTSLEVCKFVERSEGGRLRLISQAELVTRVRDELLEKVRQDLHEYFGLMPIGLLRLPNELQFRILRRLDCKSLCNMERSCSLYRHLSRAIWRHLFQRDFKEEYERLRDVDVRDWKMVYQESFERARALEEARRHSLDRTETFSYPEDWPPAFMPMPVGPMPHPMRPPGPGMLGGAHDLWPTPLMPPFRPWFRQPRP